MPLQGPRLITRKTPELQAGCGECGALTRGPARRELRADSGRRAAGLGRRRGGAGRAGGAAPPRRGGASRRVSEGLPWLGCADRRLPARSSRRTGGARDPGVARRGRDQGRARQAPGEA